MLFAFTVTAPEAEAAEQYKISTKVTLKDKPFVDPSLVLAAGNHGKIVVNGQNGYNLVASASPTDNGRVKVDVFFQMTLGIRI